MTDLNQKVTGWKDGKLQLMTLGDMLREVNENGITIEQTITGYWRAMKDGEPYIDDPACEDCYEEENLIAMAYDKMHGDE